MIPIIETLEDGYLYPFSLGDLLVFSRGSPQVNLLSVDHFFTVSEFLNLPVRYMPNFGPVGSFLDKSHGKQRDENLYRVQKKTKKKKLARKGQQTQ